jgi:hypothetical protein
MSNFSYGDVMSMTTADRRYYLGLKMKTVEKQEEDIENKPKQVIGKDGKRKTIVSGKSLNNKYYNN